ncbi:MAG: hypothetical protein M3328_16790 [Chloroflexota bacterium]|nr:hypothetical protein [Chloroflexota bacterium]
MQTLESIFHHNLWANLKLIEACRDLDDAVLEATAPGTYGSVRATLTHIARGEAGYYARLRGEQPDRSGWGEIPSLEQLREALRRTGEGLIREAARPREPEIIQVEWQGKPMEFSADILFIQAINHATEHRTHVTTILTQQGVTPPDIDGWTYMTAMKEEEAPDD